MNKNKILDFLMKNLNIKIKYENQKKEKQTKINNKSYLTLLGLGFCLSFFSIKTEANNQFGHANKNYIHDSSNIAINAEVCGYGIVHKNTLEQACVVDYNQSPFSGYSILKNHGYGTIQKKLMEEYLYGQFYYQSNGVCRASPNTYIEKTAPVTIKNCPTACEAKMRTLKEYFEYQNDPNKTITIANCPNGKPITAKKLKRLLKDPNQKELLLENANECSSWNSAFVDEGYDRNTINTSACSENMVVADFATINTDFGKFGVSPPLDEQKNINSGTVIEFGNINSIYNYKKSVLGRDDRINIGGNSERHAHRYFSMMLDKIQRDRHLIKKFTIKVVSAPSVPVPFGVEIRDEILGPNSYKPNPYGIRRPNGQLRTIPARDSIVDYVFTNGIGTSCGRIEVAPLDLSDFIDDYKPIVCSANGKTYGYNDVNWNNAVGQEFDITSYIKAGYYPYPFMLSKANMGNANFKLIYNVTY